MTDHYADALRALTVPGVSFHGPEVAQVHATLALVDAQREATEWGKEQVLLMVKQQQDFIAEIKAQLDEP